MKLQHMCLDSALDLWPPGHSELRFFASRPGSGVRKWSVQPCPSSKKSSKPRNG